MLQRDYGLSSILEPEPSNQPSISCPLEIDDSESISSRAHHLELIRDQFNEEDCRNVLVKKLSCYCRNMNYREGIQCIFKELSTWFSDENLPRSVGVLYELLEIPSEYSSDLGSYYQRWRYDHKHRKDDLSGALTPAMGNMIIGEILPTQRLIDYRSLLERKRAESCSTDVRKSTRRSDSPQRKAAGAAPHSPGISTCKCAVVGLPPHQIEHSQFVSTTKGGTIPTKIVSPQTLHNLAWDKNYGPEGQLISQRIVNIEEVTEERYFRELVLEEPIPERPPSRTVKVLNSTVELATKISKSLQVKGLRSKLDALPRDPIEELYQRKVAERPEPDTEEGRMFYSAIKNEPLVGEAAQQNAIFARKNEVTLQDGSIEKNILNVRKPTAEDLAKDIATKPRVDREKHVYYRPSFGPLTPNLLIDNPGKRMSSETRRFIGGQWDGHDSPEPVRQRCPSSSPRSNKAQVSGTDGYYTLMGHTPGPNNINLLRTSQVSSLTTMVFANNSSVSPARKLDSDSLHAAPADLDKFTRGDKTKKELHVPRNQPNKRIEENCASYQTSVFNSESFSQFDRLENNDLDNTISSMDSSRIGQPDTEPTYIRPLQIRKKSAEIRNSPDQESQRFPLRSSSIPSNQRQSSSTTNSNRTHDTQCTSYRGSSHRVSDGSASIMGNFRELESPYSSVDTSSKDQERVRREEQSRQVAAFYRELTKENPFEFEPEEETDTSRMTRLGDFISAGSRGAVSTYNDIESQQEMSRFDNNDGWRTDNPTPMPSSGYKRAHVKNSQSESIALNRVQRPEKVNTTFAPSVEYGLPRSGSSPGQDLGRSSESYQRMLHRSESSPLHSPGRKSDREEHFDDPENSYGYSQKKRGYDYHSFSSPQAHKSDHSSGFTSNAQEYMSPSSPVRGRSPVRTRGLSRSPSQQLDNVQECEEAMDASPHHSKPRARSPMKKLFGDGGWLGNTNDLETGPKYRSKKPGVLGIIKNKIGEIAERADLSPIKRSFKNESHRPSQPSTFPISLNPSEQARLYTDLELIICATANRFLMDQYKEGLMSVESVRKILDYWKSKARAQVIEFQYDQATQRDLILLNQKTFRFFGDKANNILQVNAVLWTWRENAREMSVRTFCAADSVIQKQLHDTYKVLELLGAHTITFLALQELHSHFNRCVHKVQNERLAREAAEAATQPAGVEHHWSPPTNFDSTRTRSKGSDPGTYSGCRR